MARPGTVVLAELHEQGGRAAAAVTVLEAVLDHEVTFAVCHADAEIEEELLRLTGSRLAAVEEADYVLAFDSGIAHALRRAKDGEAEYPDRGATIAMAVNTVSAVPGKGEPLALSGPGVRDSVTVWVEGFGPELQALFRERNRELPLGIDLVLIATDGRFTCLPRYTRIQGES
jgi:alpha-D-ribose 1-methylphosphonate 5-triphosphate synthase subunit PhnH